MSDWQLVPKVLTDDMIIAFAEEWYSHRQTIDDPTMDEAYAAMLAVAPCWFSTDDALTGRACQDLFLDWLALNQPSAYESYTWNGWSAALELARAAFIEGLRSAQALSKCTDDRSGRAG